MKSKKFIFHAFLLFVLGPLLTVAQDVRSIKTKVADVLALLPANDEEQAARLYGELIVLGPEGLGMVTDGVLPNGKTEGIPSRYAVTLLSHQTATKEQRLATERAYLAALSKSGNTEIKSYFMFNLRLVGSNESVNALKEYLGGEELFDPAISALVSIGTPEAGAALTGAIGGPREAMQARLIKAVGELKYRPGLEKIVPFASGGNAALKKQALWSIAQIGDAGSSLLLLQQAKNAGFNADPTEATLALVEFMRQLAAGGNRALMKDLSTSLMDGTLTAPQQHFRLAAIKIYVQAEPESAPLLVKEQGRFDDAYSKEILKIAILGAGEPTALALWKKEYAKATGEHQSDILSMMAMANRNDAFTASTLVPALSSKNQFTRLAAASEIAVGRSGKFAPALLDYLLKSQDAAEIDVARSALLKTADRATEDMMAQKLPGARADNKAALIQILSARRAVRHFNVIAGQTVSGNGAVRSAAFDALPFVSSSENMDDLLRMLSTTKNDQETAAIQSCIIAAIDRNTLAQIYSSYPTQKTKLMPVLPYLHDSTALPKVVMVFYDGQPAEREAAFAALEKWQTTEAARPLLAIRRDASLKPYHVRALRAFVSQVRNSTWPDDQKLLMLREIMPLSSEKSEKIQVLQAAGNVRTFLSLMFVAGFMDDPELGAAASRSAMQIALPTSDARPGLSGTEVRNVLDRVLTKLTGEDSQYERIDVQTYLQKMPNTRGFESIFNGVDLTGWQGLVENPIARAKMSADELAGKQTEADTKVKNNWSVKDGLIMFEGEGANLCTVRKYGDFEMIVDWKISKNGDSGIYLRGSPQVQIWDVSRIKDGAQVGSGGLYNNKIERSTPLVVADNPIGEWNTFHVKMTDDRVTVYLNGVLVVDNVVMENYWDRNIPIFPKEAIELQAHGTALAFRNIYVRDMGTTAGLSKDEKEQGFDLLFNGKDLSNWQGNTIDYVVEDHAIAIYPAKESRGNLYTGKEYGDFIFRFEFQLTPGANNGLGIHAPLQGDAAYVGKEIQILDNEAPVYAKLEVYQYHGSVYGVMPAKRGSLKPVGEWNQEEVYVKGDYIKVTLNGTVILEGDMAKASKNGTLDHKDHPGLKRHSGYIGFLGHGSVVRFRNIRIRELAGSGSRQ